MLHAFGFLTNFCILCCFLDGNFELNVFQVDHVENDGYGEGIPVLNRKTSAPVLPYGSPRSGSEEKEPPPVRRKSSELSTSMKSRLELFMKQEDEQKVRFNFLKYFNVILFLYREIDF